MQGQNGKGTVKFAPLKYRWLCFHHSGRKAMKLGIFFGGAGDVQNLVQTAVNAENQGFDTMWYGQVFGPDVMTAVALAGPATSRIEFGTSVVPTYPRHPHVMAQQALTVQAATGGRFALGLGLSHHMVVQGMWGMSYDRPAVHMREYLTIVKALYEAGSSQFNGEFFNVNVNLSVPGTQPPPVLIAALAPVMLKVAGSLADGTITWMTGPRTLETHIIPRISKAAADAGRPAPRVVAAIPVAVWDDVTEAREKAARSFAVYATLPNYRRMLDIEGVAGPADIAIVGNEAEVERQIRAVAATGVTDFVAAEFPVGDDAKASLARTRELLKTLAGKL
jgi:F420-dependent oxidoreductase-like protein